MVDGLMLTIDVRDRGPDVVIGVGGELDFGTTPELLAVAEPLVTAGRSLVLDFADVTFCDSSGLSALVRLHKKAATSGGALSVARLRPHVKATVTVTMLHRVLTIVDEVPEVAAGSEPR